MRNILILLVLISIGLTSPALADGSRRVAGDHQRNGARVERSDRHYAQHDRGQKYQHFQKRMNHLRKELRHERHDNRRLERREVRRLGRQFARRDARHERRNWRRTVPSVGYRQAYAPWIFPNILIRIPLHW